MQTLELFLFFNLRFTQSRLQKYNTKSNFCPHLLKFFFQCWQVFQPINCHFEYMFVKIVSYPASQFCQKSKSNLYLALTKRRKTYFNNEYI